MASTLSATLKFVISHLLQNPTNLSAGVEQFRLDLGSSLAQGLISGQADTVWDDQRTLNAAAETLNLIGTLVNAVGQTVTYKHVRGLIVVNTNTTSGAALTVGGGANPFLANAITIGPGGCCLLWSPVDGYTVTAATGMNLYVNAGANNIVYQIWVCGASA